MPHLITTSGSRISLRLGEGYVIGRGRECDITVEDLSCSRRHALLSLDESGECFVEDLTSRNGTYLNGETTRYGTPVTIEYSQVTQPAIG